MMSDLTETVVQQFLEYYRDDLDSQVVDERNVIISFPVHFSGFHRVEVTITEIGPHKYLISDGANTLAELKSAGYAIGSKLKKRIEELSRSAGVRIVNSHLVADTDFENLGNSIQRFLEGAKTIGDAYLVQRPVAPKNKNLIEKVAAILSEDNLGYQSKQQVRGSIENHKVDFFFPPNGVPGLALSVLANPTRTNAEAWAFKSLDIKGGNPRLKVGIVYDADAAGDSSKNILDTMDIPVPSSRMEELQRGLRSIGILRAS